MDIETLSSKHKRPESSNLVMEYHKKLKLKSINLRELRSRLLKWIAENSETIYNGMTILQWIQAENGESCSVDDYCQGILRGNWSGQIELIATS
eukprot:snap_masked-scaffold_6-processed-gene-13.42-mRNA-1 protein AED:1.00 eAED:1.00 QI:0/0/0/0/1/1/2/0/93